ncbi:MAG: leucine--tRNA ligase [Candidatus Magasanikbacteria bacterium RIFCSPHIGHO2_12_FULL_41_16]|nr:MAG: leucine--tRNA ligase [Candidatus Magasanikbacteria bacterium RIFCSPHIGHO2_12_FULL_41_16]
MNKYNPQEIELKWQKFWEENKTFAVTEDSTKEKFYGLIEFPYPSGAGLHVGHPRSYTAMDVITRQKRMEGKNVLFPIGFDSFGLPTENFAIKTGRPPAEITAENITTFTRQLKSLGFGFDWNRAVTTSEPEYYKWTQWIFLQLYKHGLAYKANQPINWCPKDKIGLANEEVVTHSTSSGQVSCCERCGSTVEKRNKEQWMLAITKYADKLLEGLNEVDYISRAKVQQENWIGKSEGAEINFALNVPRQDLGKHSVTVFTTRPDTIFGASFLAISAELAQKWIDVGWQASEEVKKYIVETLQGRTTAVAREDIEKTGVDSGIIAINPVNNESIPVWIVNYVLGDVGTGAIMAVPAHDERDFEFAQKYNLPTKEVVIKQLGERVDGSEVRNTARGICVRDGKLLITRNKKMGEYLLVGGGIDNKESPTGALLREIKEETGYCNIKISSYLGTVEHNYFHTQHKKNLHALVAGFVFELENEETVPRVENEIQKANILWLPVAEAIEKFENSPSFCREVEFIERYLQKKGLPFTENGVAYNSDFLNELPTPEAKEKMIQWLEEKRVGKRKKNYKLRDWVFSRQRYWGEPIPLVFCENCKGWIPLPEDQLPLKLPHVEKYLPTDTGESPLAPMTDWVNTTCPQCGGPARRETDTMPNWAGSSWYWLRYCDPHNVEQLASKEKLNYWQPVDWYNGGMEHTVLHLLYSRFWNQFLYDIGVVPTREPYKKRTRHGMILASDGQKMSKSLGNVVNPDEMVEQFGADALRVYILFMGPFDQAVAWDTNGLVGVRRFLERVWNLQEKIYDNIPAIVGQITDNKIQTVLHQTIKKITEDIAAMRFNTAIAKLMELSNEMGTREKIAREDYHIFIKLLAPFAPHITEELWNLFGTGDSVAYAPWPQYDSELIIEAEIIIVVQVNGKVRDQLTVSPEISEEEIKQMALSSEKVMKWLEGKEPKKVIYVKGKLVSVVV